MAKLPILDLFKMTFSIEWSVYQKPILAAREVKSTENTVNKTPGGSEIASHALKTVFHLIYSKTILFLRFHLIVSGWN